MGNYRSPMRVRLIANPNASSVSRELIGRVAERLATVCEVQLRLTERPGHAIELAGESGVDAVIGMGGDGTANEVANGVAPGSVLGVIPAGATSVFARQLGLPARPLAAAAVLAGAIAERRWRPVGLGSVNGRLFTFSAGLGLDAEATRLVTEQRNRRSDGRRPSDWAVVAAAARALRSDSFRLRERMTLEVDGRRLRASYLAVANQYPYTYFGRLPVRSLPLAGFTTALDAVAIAELRPRQLWRLPVYGLIWPRHAGQRDARVAYLHDVSAIDVTCDQPVALQVDGEYLGRVSTAAVRYHPAAVSVLIPPSLAASFPDPAPAAAGR
jgi:diacylglycerol kinase family enzyme